LSLKDISVNLTADTTPSQRIYSLASVDYLMQFKLYTKDSILISTVLHNKLRVCVVHCAIVYACTVHNTHATQVILCRHSTDNVCMTSISTLNQFL